MIRRWFPWLFPEKGTSAEELAEIFAKSNRFMGRYRAAMNREDWEEAKKIWDEYANEVPKASG